MKTDGGEAAPSPPPNPAIHRARDPETIAQADSEKARALVRAGLALLDLAPQEARRLLEGALALLEPPTGNVVAMRRLPGA